jgi:hypothetical protein
VYCNILIHVLLAFGDAGVLAEEACEGEKEGKKGSSNELVLILKVQEKRNTV